MLRALYALLLLGTAAGYYYYFGPGPTADELGLGALPWWHPSGGALRWIPTLPLALMARQGLPQALLPIVLFSLPVLGLAALGARLLRGSVSRAAVLALCLALELMVVYGYLMEGIWRFLSWRFAAVALALSALAAASICAPSLLRDGLRLPRAALAAALLALFAAIFGLLTESTGTDPSLLWNVSPWPALGVFGLLLVGSAVATLHLAAGLGAWLQGRAGRAAGLIAALALGALGGALRVDALPLVWAAGGLGLGSALYLIGLAQWRPAEALARDGLVRAAAGAFLLVAIGVGDEAAAAFQREARDVTSQTLLVALERYREAHQVYPDELDDLVPDQLEALPRPRIGLLRNAGDRFTYAGFGDSYLLEFASVQWVQCAYSPPYVYDEHDLEVEAESPEVAARSAEVAAGGKLAAAGDAEQSGVGLAGSWSCASEPPALWIGAGGGAR